MYFHFHVNSGCTTILSITKITHISPQSENNSRDEIWKLLTYQVLRRYHMGSWTCFLAARSRGEETFLILKTRRTSIYRSAETAAGGPAASNSPISKKRTRIQLEMRGLELGLRNSCRRRKMTRNRLRAALETRQLSLILHFLHKLMYLKHKLSWEMDYISLKFCGRQ